MIDTLNFFRSKKFKEGIIKYAPLVLFIVMISSFFTGLYIKEYLSFFYELSDYGGVSFGVSIYMIAVTYRTLLCTYNKIIVWSFLFTNIVNKLCTIYLDPVDFEFYINIYFLTILIPTSIAVTYYLIKSYDRKQHSN